MTLKRRIYEVLEEPDHRNPVSLVVDLSIAALIILNVIALALETVEAVDARLHTIFRAVEMFSVLVFTVEYLLRMWVCTESPRYRHPVFGRLRFAVSFFAIIDLLAVLPFYIAPLTGDTRFIRAVRLLRFLWLAKLGEHSQAVRTIVLVFERKRHELGATLFLGFILVLLASSAMYFAEHDDQPEAFADIPTAMWWSVVTMTTVGYGDVYPMSLAGRIVGALIAVCGIMMFAIPTAIIGSGFYAIWREQEREQPRTCPHCGEPIDESEE
ncbi:MAG: ion transporter [Planctomycetes bacterium]|nr:ion transporter [Planctomycetota bacterium]